MSGRRRLTTHQLAKKAEVALRELDLSTTTQADKRRLAAVWAGLEALDEEQAAVKDSVAGLLSTLSTGYSVPEVIDDLKTLVKRWEAETKARREGAL